MLSGCSPASPPRRFRPAADLLRGEGLPGTCLARLPVPVDRFVRHLNLVGESTTLLGMLTSPVYTAARQQVRKLSLVHVAVAPGDADHLFRLLTPCAQLAELALRHVVISGESSAHLASMETLQCLSLQGCELTPRALWSLTRLPRLHVMQLRDCVLPPADLDALGQAGALKLLGLAGLPPAASWHALRKLPALRHLQLERCHLGPPAMQALAGLRGLRALSLIDNAWQPPCGLPLRALPTLTQLTLQDAQPIAHLHRCAGALPALATLQLDGAEPMPTFAQLAQLWHVLRTEAQPQGAARPPQQPAAQLQIWRSASRCCVAPWTCAPERPVTAARLPSM